MNARRIVEDAAGTPERIPGNLPPEVWRERIQDFDNLEVDSCHVIDRLPDGREVVEVCSPEEAEFWTVYGHLITGGVEAFEDFPTQTEAEAFASKLQQEFPHLVG